MEERVSLFIVSNNEVLLMHRLCEWENYFVLPWGGVEANESIVDAAIREAKEETNLNVEIDKELFHYVDGFDNRVHHIFFVKHFNWTISICWPEEEKNCEENRYSLEWHDLKELKELNIYPIATKDFLLDYLNWDNKR